MSLTKLFDDLDNLITNQRPVLEIKPILTLLRDRMEALENDLRTVKTAHLALNSSYAVLIEEKAKVDRELAQLKASNSPRHPKRPQVDDYCDMESLGDGM